MRFFLLLTILRLLTPLLPRLPPVVARSLGLIRRILAAEGGRSEYARERAST